MALIYQTIPVPHEQDPASIMTALRAVIQNLQVLKGEISSSGQANSVIVFRKSKDTDASPIGVKQGDLWIQPPRLPTDIWIIQVWVNNGWQTYTP